MTSLLNIGTRSLAAAQGALSTISHNIANVNTPGYSRQEAVLSTASGQFTGSGFFGRGVDLTTVRRQYDQFLMGAVQSNTAQASADAARSDAMAQLDSLFSDPELGIGAAVDGLFSAAGDLGNRPADTSVRQAFVARADQLAQRVTAVGSQLSEMGQLADLRLTQSVAQVNQRLTEIKNLNNQIAQSQTSGHAPNDWLDQRDVALKALNELIGVSTVASSDGSINLFGANGAPLLVGNQQSELQAVPDPADASRLSLQLKVGAITQPLDGQSLGGGISGLVRFRSDDLANAMNQVGRLAVVLADSFNTQQSLGVDASGVPGRALFTVPQPVTRANSANSGTNTITATVSNSADLQPSDYQVDWNGTAYTITRLSDGHTTNTAMVPATMDGLTFTSSGPIASGNSYTIQPYAAAAKGLAAQPLLPREIATGYAATVESTATNSGSASVRQFQVNRQTTDTTLPVTIAFNNPPTTFNVTGLASGNLTNVPYTPGQRVPAAPADYNGWSLTLDGAAAAGDSFVVKKTLSPANNNGNALALGRLADAALVDGATLNESYATLVGDVGIRIQSARDSANVSSRLLTEATSRQQNVSGVNLDEEAANLLRYQQAYQASAKIIQASQQLFDTLLSAVNR
ncbi:MAG: flagellar hook-associated protein FlgK [Pseudomonadota bacterium]